MRKCKHGHAQKVRRSREYNTWRAMRKRCRDPNDPSFHLYGKRGITVCDQWSVFSQFLKDMGARPAGTSIDRMDTNGNYEPSNCRWATSTEQTRNYRRNRMLSFSGKTLCIRDWERLLGVGYGTVRARIERGWSVAKSLGAK